MVKRVFGIEIKILWWGSFGFDGGNGIVIFFVGLVVFVMVFILEILDEFLDKVC